MARWQPDSMGRLAAAALELYVEQGFEQTTVAEIAERAGLTERTFFRHFADKREVLFAGSSLLEERVVTAAADAPPSARPIDAVAAGLDAAAEMLGERREFARQRAAVIAANPELQERELIKLARLSTGLAGALRRRGVGEPAASLAAEAGVVAFRVGFEGWVSGSGRKALSKRIREALDELSAVTSSRT